MNQTKRRVLGRSCFNIYLINRSPASAIDNVILEELWLGRKSGYNHLERFGSVVYTHKDQGKLKLRAIKGVFTRYPAGTKGVQKCGCVMRRNVSSVETWCLLRMWCLRI